MTEQIVKKEENIALIFGESYEPGSFKEQLKEMLTPRFLFFLFRPGYEDEELERRDFEMNKFKTKRSFLRRLRAPLTIIGISIVFVISTWAVFGHWISFIDFRALSYDLHPTDFDEPSFLHPFGTGEFGRDVWGRLIWGARASLTMGLSSIAISVTGGIILGVIAAYKGGWIDNLIMRLGDIISSIPGLVLTIIVVTVMGYDVRNILLSWGILGITGYARLMRSAAISQRAMTYVQSAKVSGASEWRIMFRHILPNSLAPMIVAVSFDIGGMILGLAGLAFLGFGAEGVIEWGRDVSENKEALIYAPWAAIWPGLGIIITVLGFMLLGDGLRDALDPRTKV
jgi:peptide/nickel transport system permease protein